MVIKLNSMIGNTIIIINTDFERPLLLASNIVKFWVLFVKKNNEKMYSFQIIIKIIKKVTSNPVLTCGNNIFHHIFICVAPSIFAKSSKFTGIFEK